MRTPALLARVRIFLRKSIRNQEDHQPATHGVTCIDITSRQPTALDTFWSTSVPKTRSVACTLALPPDSRHANW